MKDNYHYFQRLNKILELLFVEIRNIREAKRDQTPVWHVMHTFSSIQLAKLVAIKRGIDIELAAITSAIHDLAIIKTGKREEHNIRGEPFIRAFFKKFNKEYGITFGIVSEEEIAMIIQATLQHTKKDQISRSDFVELIKDVDAVDMVLHGKEKNETKYLKRAKKVFKELNIEFEDFITNS